MRRDEPLYGAQAERVCLAVCRPRAQFCLAVLTSLVEHTAVGESREAALLDDLAVLGKAAGECEKVRCAAALGGRLRAEAHRSRSCVWAIRHGHACAHQLVVWASGLGVRLPQTRRRRSCASPCR